MTFDRILALAKKYSYFSILSSKSQNNVYNLQLGSLGFLLMNNIKLQWLLSNIKNHPKHKLHIYSRNDFNEKEFRSFFDNLYNIYKHKLPFSIIENYQIISNKKNISNMEKKKFHFPSNEVISSSTFLSKDDSVQYFFNLQRQRKIWWKKMSAYPERFHIREAKFDSENNKLAAEISADFQWGNHVVETIYLSDMKTDIYSTDSCERNFAVRICNKISVEQALSVLLFDSAEFISSDHLVLKLDKIISPYKCVFALNTSSKLYKELLTFAFFLNEEFKENNIDSILLNDTISIEKQFNRNDEWGIPYSLKIDENSITNGIVGLRFRDTTLTENVHVSELNAHILSVLAADGN